MMHSMDAMHAHTIDDEDRTVAVLEGHGEFFERASPSVRKAFYRGGDDDVVNAWVDASLRNAAEYGNLREMCANLGSWMFSVPAFLPSVLLSDGLKVVDRMTVTAEIMLMSGYCGPSAGLALTLLVEESVTEPFVAGLSAVSGADADHAGLRVFVKRDDGGVTLADTPCAYAGFLYEAATSQGLPGAFILQNPMSPLLMPPAPGSLPVKRGLLGGKHALHTPTSSYYDELFKSSDVKPAGEDTLPMPIHPYILSKVKIRNHAHGGKDRQAHGLGVSMPVMRKAYGRDCPWLFDGSRIA